MGDTAFVKTWSVAQQMQNAARDARTHLAEYRAGRAPRLTLCGAQITDRWDTFGDELREDFELESVGCARCRKAAERKGVG